MIEALVRSLKALSTDYFGVRLLTRYFEEGAVEGMMDAVLGLVDHIEVAARNEFGWYCFYHLLRSAAPPLITDEIKKAMFGKFGAMAKEEHSAKVVEQCLRHSLGADDADQDPQGWATIIMVEVL